MGGRVGGGTAGPGGGNCQPGGSRVSVFQIGLFWPLACVSSHSSPDNGNKNSIWRSVLTRVIHDAFVF